MKNAAIARLRRRLAADMPVHGLWVTLEAPSITEIAVALDLDWVVIDAEHGQLDWKDIAEHIRAAARSDTVALVRLAELNGSLIKRALDIGADGVVIPWVETAEQLRQAVAFARYPTEGVRGIGGERATAWGQCLAEHTATANEHVLVVPIIETVRTVAEVAAMCAVEGVEVFYFGPADFSSTAGYRGQWEGPGVAEQILACKDIIRRAGKQCGVVATSLANLHERAEQGFRMIGLGMDVGLLIRALRGALSHVGRDHGVRLIDDRPTHSAALAALPLAVQPKPFRVALTGDFFDPAGTPRFPDTGLSVFANEPHIEVTRFAEHRSEITPDQLAGVQGVVVLAPRVTRASLAHSDELLAIGRFGVGFDTVDVAACTDADVVAMITPGAVDRSVAEATVCWMLALTHNLRAKDLLVRTGCWDERSRYLGRELRGRTLGIVGLGRIGRALVELLHGFGMAPHLAYDPQVPPSAIPSGVRMVSLDELLARADLVTVHCPLSEQTRNLIGARELARMRRDAYLINTARGGIIDEDALFEALQTGRLAGAALDCFVGEPITAPHRFGTLDNVLLAPHSIAHTHELFRDIGRMACGGMLALSRGRRPEAGVLNPEVFERPSFRAKWQRLVGACAG